jgi:hypothetical protein
MFGSCGVIVEFFMAYGINETKGHGKAGWDGNICITLLLAFGI